MVPIVYFLTKAAAEVDTGQGKHPADQGYSGRKSRCPRSLVPSPVTAAFLAGGGVMTLICLSFCFGGLVFRLGGFALALTVRFTVVPSSERGSRAAGRSHGPGCAVSLIGEIQ